jgi:6-phosphogluconate dehydrogenase
MYGNCLMSFYSLGIMFPSLFIAVHVCHLHPNSAKSIFYDRTSTTHPLKSIQFSFSSQDIPWNKMTQESDLCDVGLYGLAVMGQNFALNMASHGFRVCVGNRSLSKVDVTVQRAVEEGNLPILPSNSPQDFCSKLMRPRKVILLVQAGLPVDQTIATLSEFLEPGDVIVDGGNEWYPNSIRRSQELAIKGILFMGMGISGGEEGARSGPSLMPGSTPEAYALMEPILIQCAAHTDDGSPCTGYIGPVGSGNYVKMVHNGIEYADMQLIAEVYDCMRTIVGLNNADMAKQFNKWNDGDLSSYLIEITAKILAKPDDLTDKGYVVDYVSFNYLVF